MCAYIVAMFRDSNNMKAKIITEFQGKESELVKFPNAFDYIFKTVWKDSHRVINQGVIRGKTHDFEIVSDSMNKFIEIAKVYQNKQNSQMISISETVRQNAKAHTIFIKNLNVFKTFLHELGMKYQSAEVGN